MLLALQQFWAHQGCLIVQGYDLEMGAGTSSPFTSLYALTAKPWRAAFVQPCRRPSDGRYGENPNRVQKYHQFQVILKPPPRNVQDLLLSSYVALGIDVTQHDIRFVEDDWENPSLGAAGLGWEVWLDGMEVAQFTYFQQMGGIECNPVSAEITYGLERIALFLQNKSSVLDLAWNTPGSPTSCTWGDIAFPSEQQFSAWYFDFAPIEGLRRHFEDALSWGALALEKALVLPAYDYCIQANHIFNILDARGSMSVAERGENIARIRHLASACCHAWVETNDRSCELGEMPQKMSEIVSARMEENAQEGSKDGKPQDLGQNAPGKGPKDLKTPDHSNILSKTPEGVTLGNFQNNGGVLSKESPLPSHPSELPEDKGHE